MISAHGTPSTAVDAIRRGALDFLEKPFESTERLRVTIQNALEQARLRDENRSLKKAVEVRHQMIGDSPALKQVMAAIGRAAPTNATVLITGRERRRQGARRADHSPQQPAQPRTVRAGQLRGDSRGPDRVGAVRPREGIVHRRDREAGRQVRAGRSRDDLPRRNRRHEREDPGQGAARASGGRGRAARVGANHQGGRPRDCRDEQEPRGGDRQGPLPGRSLLPAGRHSDLRAASAGASRGHSAARPSLHGVFQPREQRAAQADLRRRRSRRCSGTAGRATSASCGTPSSG